MPALDHGPNLTDPGERPETAARNSRVGLALFGLYLLLYGAYVVANAAAPELMERTPVLGVNLAILSGFGLIAAAFLLALVYGWICRREAAGNP